MNDDLRMEVSVDLVDVPAVSRCQPCAEQFLVGIATRPVPSVRLGDPSAGEPSERVWLDAEGDTGPRQVLHHPASGFAQLAEDLDARESLEEILVGLGDVLRTTLMWISIEGASGCTWTTATPVWSRSRSC